MAELFLTPERAFANFTYQVDVLSEPVVAALANLFDQVLNAIVQAPADTTRQHCFLFQTLVQMFQI